MGRVFDGGAAQQVALIGGVPDNAQYPARARF
jgi:hypothetical protein